MAAEAGRAVEAEADGRGDGGGGGHGAAVGAGGDGAGLLRGASWAWPRARGAARPLRAGGCAEGTPPPRRGGQGPGRGGAVGGGVAARGAGNRVAAAPRGVGRQGGAGPCPRSVLPREAALATWGMRRIYVLKTTRAHT